VISRRLRALGRVPGSAIVLACVIGAVMVCPAAAQGPPWGDPPGGGGGGGLDVRVSPDRVEMREPGVQQFDIGLVEDDGGGVTVRVDGQGRRPWRLVVQPADPDLGGYGKSLDDLLWKVDGAGRWTSLSSGWTRVACGRGSEAVTLRFRMRLDYARDRPDRYGTRLDFRARPGRGGGC